METPKLEKSDFEIAQAIADVAPSEVFTLQRMARQPGGGSPVLTDVGKYRMCALSLQEQIDADAEAQKIAAAAGESSRHSEIYSSARAICLVSRALRSVEIRERGDGTKYYPRIFTEPRQMMMAFTEPDIVACTNHYTALMALYNPLCSFKLSEVDVWIRRLADPVAGADFLGRLDWSEYPGLLMCFAERLLSLSPTLSQTPDPSLNSSDSESTTSAPGTTIYSGLVSTLGMERQVPESSGEDSVVTPTETEA